MMPSYVGTALSGVQPIPMPVQYAHDAIFEDFSNQMAVSASASRRYSRGSNAALSGNAMRVAKPTSASNSPRNSLTQQRRRTMMNDPVFIQRAQQMLDQPYLPTPGPDMCGGNCYEPVKRSARPVSWHPSTQLPQTQLPQMPTQPTQYPFPSYSDFELYPAPAHFPPTPAAYSAYSSPASAFSPLTLPYSAYELPQTYSSPAWNVSAAPPASTVSMPPAQTTTTFTTTNPYVQAPVMSYVAPSQSPATWADFSTTQGYPQSMTTPPTPEDPPKMQHPEPVFQQGDAIQYHSLEDQDEQEEEGDILIGLGLYDPPEKLPYQSEGGFFGASFDYPESTGKGLKLEDAWEPPAMEDDDDDDDDEEDGEVVATGDE